MTAIPGDQAKAFEILARYPGLNTAIDPARLSTSIAKKYPHGPELVDGEVFDLYTALLVSELEGFKQEGQNQATPEGVLFTIEALVHDLRLDQAARGSLGTKLQNLRTSSLWDTMAELLLAAHLVETMKAYTIALEYPLDPNKPVGQGKDADVAILNADGQPLFLLDVVAPQAISGAVSISEQLTDWITRKYDSKFSAYCSSHPGVRIGIVTPLIKNERFYMGLPMKLVAGEVLRLHSSVLDALAGLTIAHACSFRCPTGKRLVLDPMATYVRQPTPTTTLT